MKKTEAIDTVAMTRKIRDAMYEETKELGAEELLRYIRQRSSATTQETAGSNSPSRAHRRRSVQLS
jgi:hypothetical protein